MPYPSNCDQVEYQEFTSYEIAPQVGGLDECWLVPPDPACALEITAGTVTNVTTRGDSDGQIDVYISGATGATVLWYINGVLASGSGATSNSFTGLSAGYYTISADEDPCFDQATYLVADGAFRTGDFITTEPVSSLVAANNPIAFTIQTTTNTGNPVKSQTEIKVVGTINDGDTLTFNLEYPSEIDVVLTAKGYPDRDEYFLASVTLDATGVPVDSSTAAEIAQSIGESIEKSTELSRLYDVLVSSTSVYLTAKEANNKLDLNTETLSISTTAITQTLLFEGQAAYDGQIVENYSVYADLYVYPNAQWGVNHAISDMKKAARLELPFQLNNVHRFDLSPVVKNYVTTPKLDWDLTGFTTVSPMITEFKLQYGEAYPLIQNTNTKKSRYKGTSSNFYAINSALEWEEINTMSGYTGSKLHNLKADFDGDVTHTGSSKIQITIDDYLYDTGSSSTTDIKFNFVAENAALSAQTSGWQTSNTYEFTGTSGYNYGYIDVSGVSSGVYIEYQKDWWSYEGYGLELGNIEGYNSDPSIKYDVQFLTDTPTVKDMQRDGSDWLYIILPRNYGRTLSVRADLYFYDGTSITGQTLYNVFTGTSNAGGVFMFGSGYEQLNLEAYETSGGTNKKIRRVDFALYQTDSLNPAGYPFSEVRSYRYEIDEQPSTYEVAFLNRRGCYDTFSFVGEIVDNVEREVGNYEVPLNVNADGSIPRGFEKNSVYNTKTTKTIRANSGWIDQDHRDWLVNNLLTSNKIYDITEDNEHYIIIKSVEQSQKSSNENLYQVNVTFQQTIFTNNVSI